MVRRCGASISSQPGLSACVPGERIVAVLVRRRCPKETSPAKEETLPFGSERARIER